MRRIITLLLALSMIIAIGFALSSCDAVNQFVPGEKEDVIIVEDGYLVVNGVKTEYKVLVEEENPDNTEDEGNTENGDHTENGGTGSEIRTTVTAEEFEANMNQTNYTISFEAEATYLQEPAYGMVTASATAIYVDFVSIGLSPVPYYIVKQDNVWYDVRESENGWIGQVGNISDENPIFPLVSCVSIFFSFDHTYDSLVYDTEKKAYTYTQEDEYGGVQTHCYYFEEGKIVKCELLDTDSYGSGRMTLSISNIGTTIIEVPEFTVE